MKFNTDHAAAAIVVALGRQHGQLEALSIIADTAGVSVPFDPKGLRTIAKNTDLIEQAYDCACAHEAAHPRAPDPFLDDVAKSAIPSVVNTLRTLHEAMEQGKTFRFKESSDSVLLTDEFADYLAASESPQTSRDALEEQRITSARNLTAIIDDIEPQSVSSGMVNTASVRVAVAARLRLYAPDIFDKTQQSASTADYSQDELGYISTMTDHVATAKINAKLINPPESAPKQRAPSTGPGGA